MNCKRMERSGSRAASAYADGPWIERLEVRARMNRARKKRGSSRGVEAEDRRRHPARGRSARRENRVRQLPSERIRKRYCP